MDQSEHETSNGFGKNGQSTSQNQLCESIEMLIPAYGIGTADADERAFVETNLAACPDAAAQLAEYHALNEMLLYSAPLLQAPVHLGDKLAAAIDPKAAQPLPQSVETKSDPVDRPKRTPFIRPQYLWIAAAAILIVMLVGLNIYWIIQNDQLRNTQQQILAKIDNQDQVFRIFGAGTARRVELAAVNSASSTTSPYAAILCDPQGQRGLLYVKNFPVLPSDKAYQLWMRQDGHPVSLGVFKVDSDGTATVVFWAPKAIDTFETAGVTLEPSGGSPQPSGSAIVRGTLQY